MGQKITLKNYQHDAWTANGVKLFGTNRLRWKFRCPSCGGVQTPAQFLLLGRSEKLSPVAAIISCVKSFTDKTCTYNVMNGALPDLVVVTNPQGKNILTFPFADFPKNDAAPV